MSSYRRPSRRELSGVEDEPLWQELVSGRWTGRSRHEDEREVLLVFGHQNGRGKALSPRQREALRWAAAGLSLKEIASEMRTGVSTASTHIATALKRLGVSRADACLLLAACARDRAPPVPSTGIEVALAVRVDLTRLVVSGPLTRAELDVARQVLRGRSNLEIAITRRTSPRTVANQVAGIFRKLGVGSRAELVARWVTTASVSSPE